MTNLWHLDDLLQIIWRYNYIFKYLFRVDFIQQQYVLITSCLENSLICLIYLKFDTMSQQHYNYLNLNLPFLRLLTHWPLGDVEVILSLIFKHMLSDKFNENFSWNNSWDNAI